METNWLKCLTNGWLNLVKSLVRSRRSFRRCTEIHYALEVQNEELDQVSVGGDWGKRPKKSDVIGYVNEQPIKRNKVRRTIFTVRG